MDDLLGILLRFVRRALKVHANNTLKILALFIAALNLRLAINSISPILDTLQDHLGMNASAAGLLTAIPVLCMGLFSPLAAKLGGRYGIEFVITCSLGLVGVGTLLRFSLTLLSP